jgi:hypothetical protein
VESEGFEDDDEKFVDNGINYGSFDDEDHEGEMQQAVHSLPVNNGGLLK